MQRCLLWLNNTDTDLWENGRPGIRLWKAPFKKDTSRFWGEISPVCQCNGLSTATDTSLSPCVPALLLSLSFTLRYKVLKEITIMCRQFGLFKHQSGTPNTNSVSKLHLTWIVLLQSSPGLCVNMCMFSATLTILNYQIQTYCIDYNITCNYVFIHSSDSFI